MDIHQTAPEETQTAKRPGEAGMEIRRFDHPFRVPEALRTAGEFVLIFQDQESAKQIIEVTQYVAPSGKVLGVTRDRRLAGSYETLNGKDKLPEPGTGYCWSEIRDAWERYHDNGGRNKPVAVGMFVPREVPPHSEKPAGGEVTP